MTSSITTSSDQIDQEYPVAGIDNDSQGFRDNFNYIKLALDQASTEITELHNKAVLKATIGDDNEASNDLLGSTIENGYHVNMAGILISKTTAVEDVTVNISQGSVALVPINYGNSSGAGAAQITLTGWPLSGKYTTFRLHVYSDGASSHRVVFNAGVHLVAEGSLDLENIVLAGHTTEGPIDHRVFEFWTYNNGTHVFVRDLGTYSVPV